MTEPTIRELEIAVAKAVWYRVEGGVLYAPNGNETESLSMTSKEDAAVWQALCPAFGSSMSDAAYLLDLIYGMYGMDYNLFRDNDGWHTCEIGWWSSEAGERDQVWTANEDTMALAVLQAVVKCEAVMGRPDTDDSGQSR